MDVDPGSVAVLALLILVVAVALLVSRQGLLASSLPELRRQVLVPRARSDDDSESESTRRDEGSIVSAPDFVKTRISPPSQMDAATVTSSIVDLAHESRSSQSVSLAMSLESVGTQLERLDTRLTDLTANIDRHEAALAALMRQSMTDLAQRAIDGDMRNDAAFERLRADLLTALSATRTNEAGSRRKDVCAELYMTLARLEAALAAVSNPVLLPGEPYHVPDDLPPSSLIWDNWNDVGERVFVLADTFNAQRLHLSPRARGELGQFLTTLRTMLTGTIYPNLQSHVGADQQLTLREALDEIAREFRTVREMLEREYEGQFSQSQPR